MPAAEPDLAVRSSWEHARRTLAFLLAIAVLVSIAHFADNYFNYDEYPDSSTLPPPPKTVILLLWFAFTAAGIGSYLLFAKAPSNPSLVLLAVYSGSGLGGFGHYVTADAFHMPWWRQAAVVGDIACGLAVIAFIAWVVRRRDPQSVHT